MHRIKLVGSANKETSLGYNQETSGCHPTHFDWDHSEYTGKEERVVYLEQCISQFAQDIVPYKIGILWECYELRPWHYHNAREVKDFYTAIFTHDIAYVNLGPPFHYFPMGGSYIADWDIFPKTKMVSMIVGKKNITSGHKLRQQIAATIRHDKVDYFALPDDPPITKKAPVLRPYRFSIIVESSRNNYWMSEKLIDCFGQGTVPIYWGCDLQPFFDTRGVIQFRTVEELEGIIPSLCEDEYDYRLPFIRENFRRAQEYRCVEDWLYMHYPQYFGETI